MNDYMRALYQRFFREPAYADVRAEIDGPDEKKHPRNISSHSQAECEEKLTAMILEVRAEMAAAREGA